MRILSILADEFAARRGAHHNAKQHVRYSRASSLVAPELKLLGNPCNFLNYHIRASYINCPCAPTHHRNGFKGYQDHRGTQRALTLVCLADIGSRKSRQTRRSRSLSRRAKTTRRGQVKTSLCNYEKTTKDTSSDRVNKTGILKAAAELRNCIYQDAHVEPDFIEVHLDDYATEAAQSPPKLHSLRPHAPVARSARRV